MAQEIPAQNIYYLLLYAWNRLPEGRSINVSGVESPDLPNLVAKVLLEGVYLLQRRGFDKGYVVHNEDLTRPRGRINIGDTLSRGLLARVQLNCSTDEISRDVLHNQIIKSTLENLSLTIGIDRKQRDALIATCLSLSDIKTIAISTRDIGRVQLHGNNAFYGFLLRVCELVRECLMPEPGVGRFRFRDFDTSPQKFGLIFQEFVRNFFRLEQSRFSVSSDSFRWPYDVSTGHGHSLIPTMNTDVSLYDGRTLMIIECKWTSAPLQAHRGSKTLRSDHLYQLSAYMRHHRRTLAAPETCEGLLLYPLVGDAVDVDIVVNGQRIRARTVDFRRDWTDIHAELLCLLPDSDEVIP